MATWPPLRYVWSAALGVFAVYYALRLLFEVRTVLTVLLFGVLFGLVLVYPMNALSRVMPRWAAALLLLLAILAFDAAVALLGWPYVQDQLNWLTANLPVALERLQSWWQDLGAGSRPRSEQSLQQRIVAEIGGLVRTALPVAFTVVSVLSGCLAILALALFFAHDPAAYRRGLVSFVPQRHEREANALLQHVGSMLQRWMMGMLVAMTITGSLVALGLALLGIESWLVLGALSFALEFVPYVGPAAAALPGIAIGFAVSPKMALWVAGVYGAVQLIESYLLQPLIMKQAIRIQPAVLLVWQLVMGTVFGILGLFAATPLLACIQAAVQYFRSRPAAAARQAPAS
jgi:predicted PurR-regulated permease PerM